MFYLYSEQEIDDEKLENKYLKMYLKNIPINMNLIKWDSCHKHKAHKPYFATFIIF